MASLFGSSKQTQAQQPTAAAGITIQTSCYGKGRPIVFGTTAVSPNLLDEPPQYFQSIAHSSGGGGSGGGKGGGGSSSGGASTTYTYSCCLVWGLAEGPIVGVGTIWSAKVAYSAAQLGYSVYTGTSPQTPWGFLANDNTVEEQWTIPVAAPYTVTVNYPGAPFTDKGVSSGNGQAFAAFVAATQTQDFTVPSTAPYTVQVGGVIQADGGVVVGSYDWEWSEQDTPLTFVAGSPGTGQYTVNLATATYTFGADSAGEVATISWAEFAGGSPPEGEYTVSAGAYTFSSADAGRDVTIQYSSGNQQPPSHALAYPAIAYLAGSAIDLGDSASLPNHTVEVFGLYSNSVSGWIDADPSLIVNALLTNKRWGLGNVFSSSLVGDLSSFQSYCISAGVLVSVNYSEQASAAQMIGDLATYTNSDVAWTGGKLTLLPRGDQAISGNGATWTPPTVAGTVGDDDWLDSSSATTSSGTSLSDPLVLVRSKAADAINQVTIEILNRANQYAPEPITARDPAAIATYGLNAGQSQQAHMFADMRAGRKSAQLLLQRNALRQVRQGTVGAQWARLDIGDWLYVNRSTQNLVNRLVRITEITRAQDRSLQLVMEEIPWSAGTAANHTFATGLANPPAWNAAAPSVNTPLLFEPPDVLGGGIALWVAVSGPSGWGGCQVWASLDQQTYNRVGTVTAPSILGALAAPLPAVTAQTDGPTIDQTNTLAVTLQGGSLASTTQAGALALQTTLCWVDGEVIAYQTATLTRAKAYSLTWLVRGACGTTISAHAAGASFALLSGPIFSYPLGPSQIGQTVYLKFPSFNAFGGDMQDLAELAPSTHTVTGVALSSPLPNVTGLTTAYVAGITQLTWVAVVDTRAIDYEIRQGPTWSSAQVVGRTPLTHSPSYGDATYWVAAHYTVPNGPDVYSVAPADLEIEGSQITTNVIAGWDEAWEGWTGAMTNVAVVNGALQVVGADNILSVADVRALGDVTYYAGVAASGTYTAPPSHIINVGRVAPCQILMATEVRGQAVGDNVLTVPDIFAITDFTGLLLGPQIGAIPQLSLSQDGVTWGPWQNWIPGSYLAMAYNFQVVLTSSNSQVIPVLTDFWFAVDVPTRTDVFSTLAVPGSGMTVAFEDGLEGNPAAPFNGGPSGSAAPNIQVTIVGASAGDDALLTSVTVNGFTVQIVNSGAGVARTLNVFAQGY